MLNDFVEVQWKFSVNKKVYVVTYNQQQNFSTLSVNGIEAIRSKFPCITIDTACELISYYDDFLPDKKETT